MLMTGIDIKGIYVFSGYNKVEIATMQKAAQHAFRALSFITAWALSLTPRFSGVYNRHRERRTHFSGFPACSSRHSAKIADGRDAKPKLSP